MGGATDGTFFDGDSGAKMLPEQLYGQDIMHLRGAQPERIGRLITDALELGNKDMAYFALGTLAAKAYEPLTAGTTIRGRFYGTEAEKEQRRTQTETREKALKVLGRFLPHFAPVDFEVASSDSSIAVDLGYSQPGTIN